MRPSPTEAAAVQGELVYTPLPSFPNTSAKPKGYQNGWGIKMASFLISED